MSARSLTSLGELGVLLKLSREGYMRHYIEFAAEQTPQCAKPRPMRGWLAGGRAGRPGLWAEQARGGSRGCSRARLGGARS